MLFSCVIQSKQDLNSLVDYVTLFSFQNNSQEENEVFNFCLFLICCYNFSKISLPIEFVKDESPDFKLKTTIKEIGIEHTKATEEVFKAAESKMKKNQRCVIEYGTNKLISPGDKPEGPGIPGIQNNLYSPNWSETMIRSITKKAKLLNKTHFKKYKENHLLIEDDSSFSWFNDKQESLRLLKKQYIKDSKLVYNFDKIHIFSELSEPFFIYDVFGECLETDISKKNLRIERLP